MMLTQEAQIILLSNLFIKIGWVVFFFSVEDLASPLKNKLTRGLLDGVVCHCPTIAELPAPVSCLSNMSSYSIALLLEELGEM